MKKIVFLLLVFMANIAIAQETVGLVFNDVNETNSDGYTLFKPTSDDRAFLINNCGEVLKQWGFTLTNSRNCYILENGNVLQSNGNEAELRDWNNNLLWSINYENEFGFRLHHDIEPLPNGNFLGLVRDSYTNTEMYAEGLDTSYFNDTLVLERIVEIEPSGIDTANIVWEWKLFDHLVQEFDNTMPNYGIVADNPQLLNVNYEDGHGSNPIHGNALDYNEDLDQIALSSRHLKEVFVLDHSTTTAEAATNFGGIYGKGGDFLWRWGNPEVYNQGTIADRKLGRQHDIKWITDGPHQGKMSVFSNDGYGSNLTASSIHIIDQNANNGVYTLNAGKFLPQDYFWSWDGIILNEVMHGGAQCGLQILSNGNALINESDIGRITEVDGSGNVIWVYMIPVTNNLNVDQFNAPVGNGSFRAQRYPENYSGFDNVVFNNTGIIENENSISDNCVNLLSVEDSNFNSLSMYPNPTKGVLNFNFDKAIEKIEIFDISGKSVLAKSNSNKVDLGSLAKGLYIVQVYANENSDIFKVIKE